MLEDTHSCLQSESMIYELLCLLNLAKLNEEQKNKIENLLYNIKNWDLFFHLLDSNAVGLLSYKRLMVFQHNSNLSLKFKVQLSLLQNKIISSESRTKKLLNSLQQILKKMSLNGIEVIILKGALFANTLYEIPVYKKMNDIDILIKFDCAKRVSLLLKELGFFCIKQNSFGSNEFSEKTHHSPPYISSDQNCVVGIHWGIHAKNSHWNADTLGIWERKEEVFVCNTKAYRMSWEDNLLHLCIHLPFYKIGLRELADIYNLLIYSFPLIDIEKTIQRIKMWNAYEPVYRALSLVNSLVPQLLINHKLESILNLCKTHCSSYLIKDTDERAFSQKLLLNSRSTYISKIEKAFLLFRLSDNYFEKIKAWKSTWYLTFFPTENEIRKISRCINSKNSFEYRLARLKTPILILSALARDHGLKLLLLVTLSNIGIIFLETLKFSYLKKQKYIMNSNIKLLYKELE